MRDHSQSMMKKLMIVMVMVMVNWCLPVNGKLTAYSFSYDKRKSKTYSSVPLKFHIMSVKQSKEPVLLIKIFDFFE